MLSTDLCYRLDTKELVNKIVANIINLNLDVGRKQSKSIVDHTAIRYCNYLQHSHKWITVKDLDELFNLIATNNLGEIYSISFNSLCKYTDSYNNIRVLKNKSDVNNFIEDTPEISNNKMIRGFENKLKENPSMKEKCPYVYSILIAKEKWRDGDTVETFTKRAMSKSTAH